MTVKELFERLQARAGHEAVFMLDEAVASDGARDAGFQARPEKLVEVMRALRDDDEAAFDFLQNVTAVDWPKRDAIQIVYHLFSYRHRHSLCVRVDLPRAAPRIDSVAALWPTANWHEREQYDLMGVVFEGHPDLRRLLMPDDWVGHPMRKDFHEPKSYRGMPTSRPSPLELLQTYDRAHVAKATVATAPVPTVAPPPPPETPS